MNNKPILTRRSFLTGVSASLTLSLLSQLFPKTAVAQSIELLLKPVVGTQLPEFSHLISADKGLINGAHWGVMQLITKNNRLVEVQPLDEVTNSNELIYMAPHQVHAPNRVKYPYVRKGWLDYKQGKNKSSNTQLRGYDEWVRVSWEQAIDFVSKEILHYESQHGPGSIHAGSYGWKSVGMLHNCRALLHRTMNLAGGFLAYSGDYSTGAGQVIMSHVVGSMEVYEQQTTWPAVIENTELILLWGCDPYVTLRNSWNIPDHVGYEGFEQLKQKKIPTISIDPVRNKTAQELESQWLAIKPYTDVALLLGIAHTLIVENLYAKEFLHKYTFGFEYFKDYVLGIADNQPKTAKWAADICGLGEKTIQDLTRQMCKKRTMIMAGWGIQRQHYGEETLRCIVVVAAMLGQIGLPGGGFGFSYHYSSGGSPTARGGIVAGISAGNAPKGSPVPIPVAKIADCIANPGKTINFNGNKVTYPEVKMLYAAGGNPLHHHQDTNHLRKIWQKLETVVVNEPYWTATAKHADIVLPATTSYERDDIEMGGDYSQLYVFPMHKSVEPQYESKDDFDIFRSICAKLGKEQEFTAGLSKLQWLKKMYDGMKAQARMANCPLPTFDDFWQSNNYIKFAIPEKNEKWVRYADYRNNPLLNPLGTPTGKIEIFSETIHKMNYADCQAIPKWREPIEWYKAPIAKEFPLSLLSPHPIQRLHSQLDNTPLREKYAVANREPILINTLDAQTRNIRTGDLVRAFNKRGQILVGAVVTDNISSGCVRICEGAWFDPLDPTKYASLCKNGNVNCLTLDIGTSNLAQGTSAHTSQIQIEKYIGPIPINTAHSIPKGVV